MHIPLKLEFPSEAVEVVTRLRQERFDSCFVGGSVRDALLGKAPEDVDIVTTARPEELQKLFPGTTLVGASFGVSLVRAGTLALEVATAREERNYLDGRHPESIRFTDSLECDAARRDFTVNALLYDPVAGTVRDYVGGLEDLRRGLIRTVGDAEVRFGEDYLRMLRAIRFAARFRFAIEDSTWDAITLLASRTAQIAMERCREELDRMFADRNRAVALDMLKRSGIIKAILPEVDCLDQIEQPPQFHPEGDVWVHTLLMVSHLAGAKPDLVWSALLHDAGKAPTRTVGPDNTAHFYGHEAVGGDMAEAILERLRFSSERKRVITNAIRNHMRLAQAELVRPGKLAKWIGDEHFDLELELHRVDCMACHGLTHAWLFLVDKLAEAPESRMLPAPFIRGKDLIEAGLSPSPAFKKYLDELYELQLTGAFTDRAAALEALFCRLRDI